MIQYDKVSKNLGQSSLDNNNITERENFQRTFKISPAFVRVVVTSPVIWKYRTLIQVYMK